MDDLNKPLGQTQPAPRKLPVLTLATRIVAGLLGAVLAGFVLWTLVVRDPLGGEPIATAPVTAPVVVDKSDATEKAAAAAAPVAPAAAPGGHTVTIIDGSTGKRQEISIAGPAGGKPSVADPRLLEESRHGPIPRIAPDGTRPSALYARKATSGQSNPDGPQVAIVIGGLGVSATSTADALSRLPPDVTLAFTPYGGDLETLVGRARERGHEVLLQVPMEPHDYPDNDPGPQTLLTSLSADQNVDRLHWLFSRMQGYVGITNFMGARFTASDAGMAPVLREVARRGMIYVDDGTSARSQAGQIAGANKLPYAKADVVIDAVPSAGEIDNALRRLENVARERGMAVGYSSALPASIDRIARWTKAAQGRGIVIVPVSTIAIKARSS